MNGVLPALASALIVGGMMFSQVDVGSSLPNSSLAGLDGVERSLVSDEHISVFVFFHPEQDRSLTALGEMAGLSHEMAAKPVRWIAVMSDRFSEESLRSALKVAGLEMETIIDTGDRLYGELGVRLYPSVGIADRQGVLLAYLPYTKVNYMQTVRAHLQHALGEIDDDELEAALSPKSVDFSGNGAVAGRNIRFARMLLDSGKLDKALEKARAAVLASPDLAEAHALVGLILAEQGDCVAARTSLDRAIELDPEDATAQAGIDICR